MTTSLACFLGELLKAKSDCGDFSSFAEVLIVDDNAQLTPEHRIKNTLSFANTSGSVCHLNSRWCSQPSLLTSMKQSSPSGSSSRRNSYIGNSSCTTYYDKIQKNESWSFLHMVDSSNPQSRLNAVEPGDESPPPPFNPLIQIMKHQSHMNSSEIDAPKLPKRPTSPGSLQSILLEKRKDRPVRSSLHSALGGMAPKPSSLVVGRRSCVGKKTTNQPTRLPTTTSLKAHDRREEGSPRSC